MQHITVPLPDAVAPTLARRIAVDIEGIVNRHTGALVDATVTDLVLTDQERRVIRAAMDTAIYAYATYGDGDLSALLECADLSALMHRIDPDRREAVVAAAVQETNGHRELTRPQELAADAMAAEYGRSRVRHLSDGAVVVTGMTDDVERAQRCVERDGRERWRS